MSIHDVFSGLFPSPVNQGVSGVTRTETAKVSNGSSVTPLRNTSDAKPAAGVTPAQAETPVTPSLTGGRAGGVSEKIEETQRDCACETPVTLATPSKQNADTDFLNHAAKFCALPCPAIYSAQRWQQIQADAERFAQLWGSQVSALGWKPDDVFAIPNGLIILIEGGDILAVCEKTAVVRAPNRKQFNTIRFAALPGEPAPKWRIWASWCEL